MSAPVQRDKAKWPDIDPATVAPVRDGRPDMANYMPTRFVTLEESRARGWKHYFIGETCLHGHIAPRYTSTPGQCVDCEHVKKGRKPIGGKGVPRAARAGKRSTRIPDADAPPRQLAPLVGSRSVSAEREPTLLEKQFLQFYAQKRNFAEAAQALGKSPAEFQARLSYSSPFREAVRFLEDQYGLGHTSLLTDDFEWTDDKRKVLLRVYVNTGDLAEAIRVTGCNNWDYEEELRANPEFAAALELAEDPAKRALAREAVSRGLRGNDRLLQSVLEANLPEYSKRLDINFNVKQLTDEQLDQRLFQLLERANVVGLITGPDEPGAIEGEASEAYTPGKDEVGGDAGEAGAPPDTESNCDLL